MSRRSKSSDRWLREHFSDPFVQRARSEGWRSRAVFKLEEIDRREHLLKPGQTCLDLGAAPGAWSQYARRRSEEHTSELQSHSDLVCRLLLEKKKNNKIMTIDAAEEKCLQTSASGLHNAILQCTDKTVWRPLLGQCLRHNS